MLLVFLMYALFASIFTVAKYGLEYVQPFFLVGVRMLLAGCILLTYQYFFNRKAFTFHSSLWGKLLLLGVFNIYATNAFEFWGLQYLTSAKTCFIYSLAPFFSALLSYFVFSEVLSLKKWIGLTVGCIGFIPLFAFESGAEAGIASQFLFFSWPELSVVLAALASVYGWILLRSLVKEGDCCPIMANGLSMLVGGAMALGHSYMVEDWNPVPVTEFSPFLESLTWQILISNIICYNLYGYLLKRFSAPFLSFSGFVTPFFTAIFSWFFLAEVVSLGFWMSAIAVLCGLALFYQEELSASGVRKVIPNMTEKLDG